MAEHTKAIFPGSFDPLTNGHLDIIKRALRIFDGLTIAILDNSQKNSLFTVEERIPLIKTELKEFGDRIQVKAFSGLLVEFAKQENVKVVIRGLRAISDYDYEAQMALMNKNLYSEIETLFFIAREEYSYVSSSIVKQAAVLGGDMAKFLPLSVLAAMKKKLS